MKVICVSGTPGTGKTTLAKKLANKLDFLYIDVNRIISKHKISFEYDKKRKTKIIDTNELNKVLIGKIKTAREQKTKGMIIDSHLSHHLPKRYVNLVIITKCDISVLNKRLKKRRYSEEKIKENLQAEIFDVCYSEALDRKHKIIVVGTTKSFNMNNIDKKLGG